MGFFKSLSVCDICVCPEECFRDETPVIKGIVGNKKARVRFQVIFAFGLYCTIFSKMNQFYFISAAVKLL